jgi:hypothetical protein
MEQALDPAYNNPDPRLPCGRKLTQPLSYVRAATVMFTPKAAPMRSSSSSRSTA